MFDKLNLSPDQRIYFEKATFTNVVFNSKLNQVSLTLQLDSNLPFIVFRDFMSHLTNFVMASVDIEIKTLSSSLSYEDVKGYSNLLFDLAEFSVLKSTALKYVQEDKKVVFLCRTQDQRHQAHEVVKVFQSRLHHLGLDLACDVEMIEVEVVDEVVLAPLTDRNPSSSSKDQGRGFRRKVPMKSEFVEMPLSALRQEASLVAVEGVIFNIDARETRNGGFAATYSITDGTHAIKAFKFYPGPMDEPNLYEGNSVRVYGSYEFEARFSKDYQFAIVHAESIAPIFERYDEADEKRIEFHTHTKYSEMDGISDSSEYIEQAMKWQHPGLVLMDHSVVQSFPKAYMALKKLRKKYDQPDFKLGYGVEMNVVDSDLNIIKNADQTSLQEGSYVVFDIETTGLSVVFDEMIEFGAVLIENGRVVDSIQLFVKPKQEISAFITELTSISYDDVKDALPIDQAIDTILGFMKDHVLVAHNATFDMDFIQEILYRLGRPALSNTVIDTLDLSRALYEGRRSYRLGAVARQLKIGYDDSVSHRADYDAEVLSLVFLEMLRNEALENMSIVDELASLSDEKAFAKVRKKHMTLISKTQVGLKHMFELISLSHTKYLASFSKSNKTEGDFLAEPRMIREEIAKRKEHFLVGAGCTESELFELASNKGDRALKEAVAFYDYVEIMPLDYYAPLIERHAIKDEARLKEILNRLIQAADEAGVCVIASGNAHYNHPREKIMRDIYIHSQGIGGTRHPLFIFNQERRLAFEAPDQHFRTTDEMLEAYAYLGNEKAYEYVISNPRKLFEQIGDVAPQQKDLFTPHVENADEMLTEIVYRNAHELYGNPLPEIVSKRIERELESIIGHGFGVIYYISHLLVKKSLDDGYLVGSRGSVGSSLVATMAEITEVNPLTPHYVCKSCHYHEFFENGEYASGFDLESKLCPKCQEPLIGDGQDIPFETFLGFEGDKVPDIDLNFSGAYQEVAHNFTKVLFGDQYVYRAGTISTVAERTAFGYVFGYQESTHQVSQGHAWNEYLAKGAEGVKRTTGQHPGGIIVIPDYMDVHDFTPIQFPANNPNSAWLTTHFEFHDIDENVLKLDILGHVDPTAMKLLEELTGIDIHTVPMNDPETLSLFGSTDALQVDERSYQELTGGLGIPEFGTKFVRRMLEATRPNKFSDLVRISGLSHGTDVWATNAEELIKQGMTLDQVIGCRDDIMVYLMQYGLAPKTAFDIMESVRKGRGLSDVWMATMRENKIPEWYIDSCLKIKYMFPKAHAVAYVMMAVRVAWFKVHQPLAYYATYFTLRVTAYEIETMSASKEVVKTRLNEIEARLRNYETKRDVSIKESNLIDTLEVTFEMQSRGFHIEPIDLMKSHATKWVLHPDVEGAILPPFNVIDGLGDGVAQGIVDARNDRPFISKKDLMSRSGISGTVLKKMDDMHVTDHLQESNQLSLFDI